MFISKFGCVIFFLLFKEYYGRRMSPNIIFILADDLGWNDVSFHGSNEILTPNIDALAYNGVILNNHYSETLCSPSRAALLTGKYPIHTGMQHNVVMETHASGLSLKERLLPQYLKSLGYKSHAVGKWHLGFYKKEYTPPYRGFDSFYGLWNGYHDYYKHNVQAFFVPFDGYDMRRNMSVDWSARGHYSTDLFTDEAINIIENHDKKSPLFLYLAYNAPHAGTYEDPLQVPDSEEDRFLYIKDSNRKRYAAMVSRLDSCIGKVIEALQQNSMLDNSIIVFISDNGAPTFGLKRNYGSNWPLKGEKSTPWEGGIKTVACIWSSLMKGSQGRISNQLIHISDWLPTLFAAAGGDELKLKSIDGSNLWEILRGKKKEFTNYLILHNIDEENGSGYAAIREGPFKLVNGTSMLGFLDDWFGAPQQYDLPPYDIDAVKDSKVNAVLSSLEPGKLLTSHKINRLREATRTVCKAERKINATENPCEALNRACLFDTFNDPCENHNLYGLKEFRDIQARLETKLNEFRKQKVRVPKTVPDMRSNPAMYNNTWVNWGDLIGI